MVVEIIIHISLYTCLDFFPLVFHCDDIILKTHGSPGRRDFRHRLGPEPKHLKNGQSSFEHRNMPERKKTKGDLISPDY